MQPGHDEDEVPSLTRDRVVALGAERLADLVLELTEQDEELATRLLRAVSASVSGEVPLARRIRKDLQELLAVGRIRGRGAPDHVHILEGLRRSIAEDIQPRNARLAADLLGELVRSDAVIFEQVDDSDGEVGDVLREAVRDWGRAWAQVSDRDPRAVAKLVWDAYRHNDYGARDYIIESFAEALGAVGLSFIEEPLEPGWTSWGLLDLGRAASASTTIGPRCRSRSVPSPMRDTTPTSSSSRSSAVVSSTPTGSR